MVAGYKMMDHRYSEDIREMEITFIYIAIKDLKKYLTYFKRMSKSRTPTLLFFLYINRRVKCQGRKILTIVIRTDEQFNSRCCRC